MTGNDDLMTLAKDVRRHSRSRYSGFAVGAAMRGASGRTYVGTNVESSSLGLTICAERAALCAAMAAGETEVVEVAVIADCPEPVGPCGACRQLIFDYGPRARVLMGNVDGARREATIAELLPLAFSAAMLPRS